MRITVSHDKGQQEAMKIVDETIEKMFQPAFTGPVRIANAQKSWTGSTMVFNLTARMGPVGVPIQGLVIVGEKEITIECELPWLLTKLIPEKQVKAGVESKVRGLLKG